MPDSVTTQPVDDIAKALENLTPPSDGPPLPPVPPPEPTSNTPMWKTEQVPDGASSPTDPTPEPIPYFEEKLVPPPASEVKAGKRGEDTSVASDNGAPPVNYKKKKGKGKKVLLLLGMVFLLMTLSLVGYFVTNPDKWAEVRSRAALTGTCSAKPAPYVDECGNPDVRAACSGKSTLSTCTGGATGYCCKWTPTTSFNCGNTNCSGDKPYCCGITDGKGTCDSSAAACSGGTTTTTTTQITPTGGQGGKCDDGTSKLNECFHVVTSQCGTFGCGAGETRDIQCCYTDGCPLEGEAYICKGIGAKWEMRSSCSPDSSCKVESTITTTIAQEQEQYLTDNTTPTPTDAPLTADSPTPTPTPVPRVCNEYCVSNDDCATGLSCVNTSGSTFCRNASCQEEYSCTCPDSTTAPTATPTPTTVILANGDSSGTGDSGAVADASVVTSGDAVPVSGGLNILGVSVTLGSILLILLGIAL